jgi:L-lactate dehydrogenase (cytochrome)
MRLDRIVNVADARAAARRTLPRVVFDYIDGAADDEVTMRQNTAAFEEVSFRPRMAVADLSPDLATTALGTPVSMPVLLAPCGLVRAMHPDAGPGVARAAASRGVLSVLSTVAGSPVGPVAAAAPGRVWFQLYSAGGRPVAEKLCEQAASAGVSVLVVTLDTPALGNRERDLHNGVATPLRIDAHNALQLGPQVLARPGWAYRMARDGISLVRRSGGSGVRAGADVGAGLGRAGESGGRPLSMTASPFSWDDVEWLRKLWKGPLVVKGLMSGEDARRAVGCGADGIVVSNHGGRQLDGAPATFRVLPEVASALASEGGSTELFLDGGVRRGTHVVKALALGARAVFVGRPYLWGLAVGGQRGVERVLDIYEAELRRTMVLLGCRSVGDLGPDWLQPAG